MSWHFSQALVAEYSAATCSDGEQFAPLRSTTMQEAYCWRDRMTESLDLFQFGMTLQPSTENLGAELLTWYRGGFHVLTLASPGQCGVAMGSTEKAAGCGTNTFGSLTRLPLELFGGRIRQNLKAKDLPRLFEHFPREGMFVDGQLLVLDIVGCLIQETGFGFTLPTPTSRDWKDTPGMKMTRKDGKSRADRLPMLLFSCVNSAGIQWNLATDTAVQTVKVRGLIVDIKGREYCPELPEWLMGWPIGWTDLKPLATDKYHEWLPQHSAYYQAARVANEEKSDGND